MIEIYDKSMNRLLIPTAICKGIVEAQKGKIWFESEEGKGSTFYFVIPVGGVQQ